MELKKPMYNWDEYKEVARDSETYQVDEERTNILRRMRGNFKKYSPEEEVIVAPPPPKIVRVPRVEKKSEK